MRPAGSPSHSEQAAWSPPRTAGSGAWPRPLLCPQLWPGVGSGFYPSPLCCIERPLDGRVSTCTHILPLSHQLWSHKDSGGGQVSFWALIPATLADRANHRTGGPRAEAWPPRRSCGAVWVSCAPAPGTGGGWGGRSLALSSPACLSLLWALFM